MHNTAPDPKRILERRRRRKYRLVFFGMAFVLILGAILLTQCAVKRKTGTGGPVAFAASGLEIPRVDDPEFLVVCQQGRYTLLYDTLYRQAAWTAHVLTRSDLENRTAQRQNRFVVCESVRAKGWPYATDRDYIRTGYDRGHLVPSADRLTTQSENDATFRLSNIAPQTPRLNRVVWNNLETEIRRMTRRLDTLWIVTGSELKPGLKRIGPNGIGVPEHFYKVLLAQKGNDYRAIGFVIPNRETLDGVFWDYAVTVDSVEKLSGIDFFPNLPGPLQRQAESECRPERWKQ